MTAAILTSVVGVLFALAGVVSIARRAFKISKGWGWSVLLIPGAPILFAATHWNLCKKPFLTWLLGLALMIGGLLPFKHEARQRALGKACTARLRNIHLALHTYSNFMSGHLPTNLSTLVSQQYLPREALHCPADPEEGHVSYTLAYPADAVFVSLRLDDEGQVCVFVVEEEYGEPKEQAELVKEVSPYHADQRAVLFADGHIGFGDSQP